MMQYYHYRAANGDKGAAATLGAIGLVCGVVLIGVLLSMLLTFTYTIEAPVVSRGIVRQQTGSTNPNRQLTNPSRTVELNQFCVFVESPEKKLCSTNRALYDQVTLGQVVKVTYKRSFITGEVTLEAIEIM